MKLKKMIAFALSAVISLIPITGSYLPVTGTSNIAYAGGKIAIVQVVNETNSFFCGEKDM